MQNCCSQIQILYWLIKVKMQGGLFFVFFLFFLFGEGVFMQDPHWGRWPTSYNLATQYLSSITLAHPTHSYYTDTRVHRVYAPVS